MSVIVIVKVAGDTDAFKAALTTRADDFRAIGERVRAAGALRHEYALTEDHGYIIDEWETAEAFRALFSQPDIQGFMYSVGVESGTIPEITIAEAVDSPDRY